MLKDLFIECDISLVFSYFGVNRNMCQKWIRNVHSFWNTLFHFLCGVHDFTHSLYILHRLCQSKDYVYGLMTQVCLLGLVWLLYLYRTYFIILGLLKIDHVELTFDFVDLWQCYLCLTNVELTFDFVDLWPCYLCLTSVELVFYCVDIWPCYLCLTNVELMFYCVEYLVALMINVLCWFVPFQLVFDYA